MLSKERLYQVVIIILLVFIGYLYYRIETKDVTISFSNPVSPVGTSKQYPQPSIWDTK